MIKRINRLRNKSFEKTLLDRPVPNKKVKFSLRGNKIKSEIVKLLPKPLKPTKATPRPIPKPRIILNLEYNQPPKTESSPKTQSTINPKTESSPKTQSTINETCSIT